MHLPSHDLVYILLLPGTYHTSLGATTHQTTTLMDNSPQTSYYPYLVLATSLFMMVAGTGSVYLLVAALKPIALEFDWPRSVPSLAYSLQYLGGGIGGIMMGYWLDRVGMAKPASVGACMIGLGGCLTYYVDAAWQLYAIYGLMMGLAGRASLFSPLMVNITYWFERKRGMAVGIVGSGQAIAGAMWPAIFQYGIATVGWRETAFRYGVFVLVTMLPLALVFTRKRPGPSTAAAASQQAERAELLPPARLTALLCIAIVGCCVAMSLPLAHLMSHASDVGYTPVDGARLLSVMLICAAMSSLFLVGTLSVRLSPLGGLLVFSTTQAVTLGMFPLVDGLTGLYIVAMAFGFGYGGVLPSYPIIIREYVRSGSAGTRTGLVVFFGTIGMAIGSSLGGVSFDLTGSYAPAFYAGVACNAANLVIIGYLLRVSRQRLAHASA